ncbi:TetR/AcrR family transcriptional regulator [Actinomadura parmotrematis]|uniref:TetR/AcrR family transcriptional regulator n=1 Tax=Actinomadura parmotrematis TaxID=2864039 RepID=A0ABS7FT04_9ACTN|nr:TetR/AcrR family transcriptional regulator [Actinomadura parmotrematis]MBW8483090.1 TetR/AcrR family transcriptional regulator [Actinomadura parmotrematis]
MDDSTGLDRILRAALTLFARDGTAATTLTALRREAGVSVGSFYHHFHDKEEVAAALFTASLRLYQRGFVAELRRHPDPGDALAAMVAFHLDWCGREPERARFLFTERRPRPGGPGAAALAEQNRWFFGEITAWWEIQRHHGALPPLDLTTALVLWLGPAQELCRLWLAGQADAPSAGQAAALGDAARRVLLP